MKKSQNEVKVCENVFLQSMKDMMPDVKMAQICRDSIY